MKILNPNKCKELISGDISIYLKNLEMLIKKDKPYIIRIPFIPGYTDTSENVEAIIETLKEISHVGRKPLKVEIIKGHKLGNSKYQSLGLEEPKFEDVSDTCLEELKERIEKIKYVAEICRI